MSGFPKCLDPSLSTMIKQQLVSDEELRNTIIEVMNTIRRVEDESRNFYDTFDYVARRDDISLELLRNLESRTFELKNYINEAQEAIEDLKSLDLITDDCYKRVSEYLSQLRKSLEIVENQLKSLLERVPGVQANTIYEELNIRLGLPVFSANLRGAPLTVDLVKGVTASPRFNARSRDCTLSISRDYVEEDDSNDPVVALYKLTPLSVTEARGRLAYTLVPPADRRERETEFRVHLGYAAPWRDRVYVCNCIDGRECRPDGCEQKKRHVIQWITRLLFNGEIRRKDIVLGVDVNSVNIPEYESAYRTLFCGNNILTAFKVEVSRWGRPHHTYALIFMKDGYDAASATLPAGICTLGDEVKIFIGLPLATDEEMERPVLQPTFSVKCPLVTLYEEARRQNNGHYMRLLESICPRLSTCFRRRDRALVIASDVYSYLIGTKPIVETSITDKLVFSSLSLGAFKADVAKGTVMIGYGKIVIESRYVGERLLYPLPFTLKAWIQDTYMLLIRPEKGVMDRIAEDTIEEITARGPDSVYTRQLFAKLVLAAGSLVGKQYWEETLAPLLLSHSTSNTEVVLERLVYFARRVADKVASGESYISTLSGLRRATTLLMDLAMDVNSRGEPSKLKSMMSAFAELVARNSRVRRNLATFLRLSAEFSLAHYIAYCIGGRREYLDALELRIARSDGERVYALIEKRQGGFGYLATLDEETVKEYLASCKDIISDTAQRVTRQGTQGMTPATSVLADVMRVLEEVSLRTARAYGQVDSRSGNVRYTYIPAWLVRLVLTEDKLKEYAEKVGIALQPGYEPTWRMIQHEIVAEYFDIDFMDASQYDIAGINSWMGEYEKKILLNNRYALQTLTFVK